MRGAILREEKIPLEVIIGNLVINRTVVHACRFPSHELETFSPTSAFLREMVAVNRVSCGKRIETKKVSQPNKTVNIFNIPQNIARTLPNNNLISIES